MSTVIDASAVARVTGVGTTFKDLKPAGVGRLPMRIAVVGQGNTAATYPTTKQQITSSGQAAEIYGYGSPIHLACRQLFPSNGDGVGQIPVTVYPLEDAGSGVEAEGDITPVGTPTAGGSFRVRIGGIYSAYFRIEADDSVGTIIDNMVAAINAVLAMPMAATDGDTVLDLAAKWAGASGNGIVVSVEGPTDIGVTFTITQPTGGDVNPDVDDSLNQIGNIWETLVLNCMNVDDEDTLDKYDVFNEGRWLPLVRRPFIVFSGDTQSDVDDAITVPDGRPNDRTNAQITAPGSDEIPFVVAARALSRIAVLANNTPPHDYGRLPLSGMNPGTDAEQWTYTQRDQAVKAGSSTSLIRDGVVTLEDVVTFYHPTAEEPPAYRFVVDIVKVMNVIFNIDAIFLAPEWDGAPLIPDNQVTVEPTAKQPKAAKAAIAEMIDGLALRAILSDPDAAKATIVADINSENPKRLDVGFTAQISGNTNIKAIDFNWGFYYGALAA